VVLLFTLVLSSGQLIFHLCQTFFSLPSIIGIILFIAMMFKLSSMIVFGVGAFGQFEVGLNSGTSTFLWAFYVSVAALLTSTLAGLIFLQAGRKYLQEMHGYGTPFGAL